MIDICVSTYINQSIYLSTSKHFKAFFNCSNTHEATDHRAAALQKRGLEA